MKRLLSLLVSATLTATIALTTATPVFASGSSQYDTNYNNYCDVGLSGGDTRDGYGFDIYRPSFYVGHRILGSRSTITARALWPCLDGYNPYVSKSYILGANIQSDAAADGAYNFVQGGIGKINFATGVGQDCSTSETMVSDQTHFVYTPDTTGSGIGTGHICRASFVDFNNDGTPDDPVGGAEYRTSIQEYNSGSSNYWRLCFTRLSDGAYDCKNLPRTTNDGGVSGNNAAWWACEVGNNKNALGVPQPDSKPTISVPQYMRADNGQWYYTEDSAANGLTGNPWGASPWYMQYSNGQLTTGENLNCWTESHDTLNT